MSVYQHENKEKKEEFWLQFVDFPAVAISMCKKCARKWRRHRKVINVA